MYIVTYKMSILDERIYSEEIEDEAFHNKPVSKLSYEDIQNELWNYRKKVNCCPPDYEPHEFVIMSVTKLKK